MAATSASPGALRPIALVAALNAACQGLVGVVLSVLALCVCFCGLGTAPTSTINNDFAGYVTSYLQGDECRTSSVQLFTGVTGATALRIWMALSLLFSLSMMTSSIVLAVSVVKQWSEEKLQIALVSWLFINTFTAIDDLILGSVFSSDFSKTLVNASSTNDNFAPLTLAVVAFLAFRGGYLWLFNMALIIYLIRGARDLHTYLSEQLPRREPQPIQSWPTLDDFGKDKGKVAIIERTTPNTVNPQMSERVQNGQGAEFPEHTALARWPTLNGQAHTMRESRQERSEGGGEDTKERRERTMRESSLHRQEGFDNPTFVNDVYYLRLQSEAGSTRDFEEYPNRSRGSSDWEPSMSQVASRWAKSPEIDSNQWDLPKSQDMDSRYDLPKDRSKRNINDSSFGHYRQNTQDSWSENTVPASPTPPSSGYTEENGIPIPPVDYLDPSPDYGSLNPEATNFGLNRPQPSSLQQAILDRTLRLKKVPDALKKGFK